MLGAAGERDLSTLDGELFRSTPRKVSTTALNRWLSLGTLNCAIPYHHPVVLRTRSARMPMADACHAA